MPFISWSMHCSAVFWFSLAVGACGNVSAPPLGDAEATLAIPPLEPAPAIPSVTAATQGPTSAVHSPAPATPAPPPQAAALEPVNSPRAPPVEPALEVFPPSVRDTPATLPLAPFDTWFDKRMLLAEASTFGTLFGRGPEALAPLAGGHPEEVEDTRPWELRFVTPTDVAASSGKLEVTWAFLDRELYALRFDFRERGANLLAKMEKLLARPRDEQGTLRNGALLYLWRDGSLVLAVEQLKGRHVLVVADRARYSRSEARLAKVDEAEKLVYGSMDYFYSARLHNLARALEDNRRAAELVPDFGDAWVNVCHAEYNLATRDEFGSASAACQRAIAVTHEDSVRGEASYYLGLIAVAERNVAEGLRLLRVAQANIPRAWGMTSDVRLRIAGLERQRTEAVLERAIYDFWCASLRDGTRSGLIPGEFGFDTYETLRQTADDELVDIDGIKEKAVRQCARK